MSASQHEGYRLKNIQFHGSQNMITETFTPKKQPLSLVKKAKYIGVTFQPTVVPYSSQAQQDPFILARKYDDNNSARDTLRVLVGNKFNDCHILSANYPAVSVRDPSIAKIGNKYFIIYTRGLLCTKDFNHWKKLPWPNDKGFNYSQDWAPEFVANRYVVMSKAHTDYYHHQLYLTTFENGVIGKKWTQLTGDFPKNVIDPHIQYAYGKYYLFFKDESKQKLMVGESNNLEGPYTTRKINVHTPFYGIEGPEALYQHGKWILYFDTINLLPNGEPIYHGLFYSTSEGLHSWSKIHRVNQNQVLRHGEIICNR